MPVIALDSEEVRHIVYRALDSGLVASCGSGEVVARRAGERLPYTSV